MVDDSLEQWVSDETRISVFHCDLNFRTSLMKLHAGLEAGMLDIPPKYRATAVVEVDHGDLEWGDPVTIEVYYLRPATDEEKEEDRQAERDRRKAREDEARAKYEELKVRFDE